MILGIVEHERGRVSALSLQMLTFARSVAAQRSLPVHALLIGADASRVTAELAAFGVSTVHLAEHERLTEYSADAWARCAVELAGSEPPEIMLAAGSDRGHEMMASVAARLDLPLVANCTDVRFPDVPGAPLELTRLRWGGSLLEDATLAGAMKLLTVAPHSVAAEPVPVASRPDVRVFTPALDGLDSRVRLVGRVEPDRSTISLADAKVVVGGGRGVGSQEGFGLLQELAGLLGGTVGCSRAVTSLGWRPHSDQVGQTGTRISPDVYIACGISGAIQHMVGCKSARCIVAINKDADAPIMALADYAVVGDLQQVLPALNAEIRRAKGSR